VKDVADDWPELPLDAWQDTYATLHRWTQIVGKIRTKMTAPVNHWWHATLYVSPRGLTTFAIPYQGGVFEMDFDFLDHELAIRVSDGGAVAVKLAPRSVADFYSDLMSTLQTLGIDVEIWTQPMEIPVDAIRFPDDHQHDSYDPEHIGRLFRILTGVHTALSEFRGEFIGKSSPVHFFWGSFDLAVSRFSGRRAPEQEGMSGKCFSAWQRGCFLLGKPMRTPGERRLF